MNLFAMAEQVDNIHLIIVKDLSEEIVNLVERTLIIHELKGNIVFICR